MQTALFQVSSVLLSSVMTSTWTLIYGMEMSGLTLSLVNDYSAFAEAMRIEVLINKKNYRHK